MLVSALVCASGIGLAADGQIFYAEDASPAIRVYNSGSELVTIQTLLGGAGTNVVTIGSIANTIDGSGTTDSVAELAAAIAACTNSAGKTPLTVDIGCNAASTESTDGELLDATVTIRSGSWGEVTWDTSDVKWFRTYLPSSANGASRSGALVTSLYGNVGGTGDVTIRGYLDGSKIFEKIIESPIGVLNGPTNLTDNVTAGCVEIPLNLYVGKSQRFMISSGRATTGTTGGIGIRTDYK